MEDKFKIALKARVIPVVVIDNADNADALADSLIEGGLPSAEITFRTDAATEVIKKLVARGDLIIGAGTVMNIGQAQQAIDNGACFIISPYLSEKVVRYCLDLGIPVVPGVSTPTDIGIAGEMGLSLVKYFPAVAFGGLNTLDAFSAAFTTTRFIPTGGIGPSNLVKYLNHPKVIACGGSWMVRSDLIAEKRFDEISRLTKEAVELVRKAGA